jgi:hypothetical protein
LAVCPRKEVRRAREDAQRVSCTAKQGMKQDKWPARRPGLVCATATSCTDRSGLGHSQARREDLAN